MRGFLNYGNRRNPLVASFPPSRPGYASFPSLQPFQRKWYGLRPESWRNLQNLPFVVSSLTTKKGAIDMSLNVRSSNEVRPFREQEDRNDNSTFDLLEQLQKVMLLSANILTEQIVFLRREEDTYVPLVSTVDREKNLVYLEGKLSVYLSLLALLDDKPGTRFEEELLFLRSLAERTHLANDLDL